MDINQTTPAPPLWLCAHECGHAIVHGVRNEQLSAPATTILSVTTEPSNGYSGHVRVRWHCPRRDTAYDAARCLGGYVAENRWRGNGAWEPTADDFAAHMELADIRHARAAVAQLAPADPMAEMLRAWREARDILAAEWLAVIAVALRLQAKRVMTGEDFAAEWRAARRRAVQSA